MLLLLLFQIEHQVSWNLVGYWMVMFERPSNCCQFYLDIINCVDDHGCDDNATCTDENGSYICVCDSGFTGDGFNCTGKIMLNRFSDDIEWSSLVVLDWVQ